MRSREDIMKEYTQFGFGKSLMNVQTRAVVENPKLLLEVLLDIRDLLLKQEKGALPEKK